MKKIILALTVITATALSAWMPVELSSATGNANSISKYSLPPIIPIASYGSFSATVSGFPNHTVAFSWTTTAETNVVRFKIYREDKTTSEVVTDFVNAKSTAFPRSYSIQDNSVVNGHSYEYSINAVSADGSLGSPSDATYVMVPMSTR